MERFSVLDVTATPLDTDPFTRVHGTKLKRPAMIEKRRETR
jgi:hypothetical protein